MKKFLLFSLCITTAVMSWGTPVRVALTDNSGRALNGATVKLYQGSKLLMVEESAPAILRWFLEEGHPYTIEVSRKGFITKRLDIAAEPLNQGSYNLTVALVTNTMGALTPRQYAAYPPSAIVHYENGRWVLSPTDATPAAPDKMPVSAAEPRCSGLRSEAGNR